MAHNMIINDYQEHNDCRESFDTKGDENVRTPEQAYQLTQDNILQGTDLSSVKMLNVFIKQEKHDGDDDEDCFPAIQEKTKDTEKTDLCSQDHLLQLTHLSSALAQNVFIKQEKLDHEDCHDPEIERNGNNPDNTRLLSQDNMLTQTDLSPEMESNFINKHVGYDKDDSVSASDNTPDTSQQASSQALDLSLPDSLQPLDLSLPTSRTKVFQGHGCGVRNFTEDDAADENVNRDVNGDGWVTMGDQAEKDCRDKDIDKDFGVLNERCVIKEEVENDEPSYGQSFDACPSTDDFVGNTDISIKKEMPDTHYDMNTLPNYDVNDQLMQSLGSHSDNSHFDYSDNAMNPKIKTEPGLDDNIFPALYPPLEHQIKTEPSQLLDYSEMDSFNDSDSPTESMTPVKEDSCPRPIGLYPANYDDDSPLKGAALHVPSRASNQEVPAPSGTWFNTDRSKTDSVSVEEYVDMISDLICKGNKKNIVLKGPTSLIRDVARKVNENIKRDKNKETKIVERINMNLEVSPKKATVHPSARSRSILAQGSEVQRGKPNNYFIVNGKALKLGEIPDYIADKLKHSGIKPPILVINNNTLTCRPQHEGEHVSLRSSESKSQCSGDANLKYPLGLNVKDITQRPLLPKSFDLESIKARSSKPSPATSAETHTLVRIIGYVQKPPTVSKNDDPVEDSFSASDLTQVINSPVRSSSVSVSEPTKIPTSHAGSQDGSKSTSFVHSLEGEKTFLVPKKIQATNSIIWRPTRSLSSQFPIRITPFVNTKLSPNMTKSREQSGFAPKISLVIKDSDKQVKPDLEKEKYAGLTHRKGSPTVRDMWKSSKRSQDTASLIESSSTVKELLKDRKLHPQRNSLGDDNMGPSGTIRELLNHRKQRESLRDNRGSATATVSLSKKSTSKQASEGPDGRTHGSDMPRRSGRVRKPNAPYSPPLPKKRVTSAIPTCADSAIGNTRSTPTPAIDEFELGKTCTSPTNVKIKHEPDFPDSDADTKCNISTNITAAGDHVPFEIPTTPANIVIKQEVLDIAIYPDIIAPNSNETSVSPTNDFIKCELGSEDNDYSYDHADSVLEKNINSLATDEPMFSSAGDSDVQMSLATVARSKKIQILKDKIKQQEKAFEDTRMRRLEKLERRNSDADLFDL